MEFFAALMSATLDLFKLEFTLYGFTFSLWEVFLFSIVASILGWVIGRIFSGE